ncbi:hypothetical protein QVD17_42253 [Tagetes erecta]|uniref:TPX2 C-terminal domain-containing protein n=1 Tax=Tagetes erecta TaxID=13708 RepID=A0AAD8JLY6_TARER|nr:hypothetical protein QVD17_42253 [Tagetes erecta]
MGEAAAAPCLMRSVSQPLFASRQGGDPLRALTTSVSFGRFMTEPLDWERWSSFSHNRIQEDVQKHSRPGAVAEKKAFFEAYFNRFASKKPPNKENKPPQTNASPLTLSNTQKIQSPTVATDENREALSEITPNQDVSSPSISLVSSKSGNVDGIVSSNHRVELELSSNKDVSSPLTNLVCSKVGNVDGIVSSNQGVELELSSNKDVRSPLANLVPTETGNVDDIISSTSQVGYEKPSSSTSTNLVYSQVGNVEDVVSSDRGAEGEIASNKDACSSTTNLVFSENGNVNDIILSGEQMEQERRSTENVSLENQWCRVNQSSHVDKNKKTQIKDKIARQTKIENFSVKSSSRIAPIPEIHPEKQIFKCNPRDKIARQTKTEFFSIKSSSGIAAIPEIHPKNQIFKCNSRVPSVNVVKKISQALPRSENKRSKPLVDRSNNDNKTVVLKSHLTNHSEASKVSTKKPRSVTVPSSFNFKSDERAAKRKQFFQKLEEKPKLKEQARSDDKRLRGSTALEAKPCASEIKGPSNKIQKVQLTRACLQKLGMKPKNFIEINKKMLSSSMACLPSL